MGRRRDGVLIAVALAAYAGAFLIFFPDVFTISDEAYYVEQALAFADGRVERAGQDYAGRKFLERPSHYPPGTSLLMVPGVLAFGFRGAFLVPLLALVLAVWITGRWLEGAGKPPWFALLVLAYPPALAGGRLAMSDLPSTAAVAAALAAFFAAVRSREATPRARRFFASGVFAGASLLLRETNILLPLPFFLGAALRRDRGVAALIAGSACGGGLRLLVCGLLFDDPFHLRPLGGYGFSAAAFARGLPFYALAMTLLVPGGLPCALRYRGSRRPELIAAVLLFIGFYSAYEYTGEASGPWKGALLRLRYLAPLAPLLAYATGAVAAEWLERALRLRRLPQVFAAAVAIAGVVAQLALARWSASQRSIRDAIYAHTADGAIVATNTLATRKFISEAYGHRVVVDRAVFRQDDAVRAALSTRAPIYVVLLDRSDSAFWRQHAGANRAFVRQLGSRYALTPVFDAQLSATDHLRISRLERPE